MSICCGEVHLCAVLTISLSPITVLLYILLLYVYGTCAVLL